MGFFEILGQEEAVGLLQRLWMSPRKPPFLLFIGPSGVGRKRAALAYAQALLCEDGGCRGPVSEGSSVPRSSAQGGCGQCASCRQAAKGVHPDCVLIDFAYQEKINESASGNQLVIETFRETIPFLRKYPLNGRYSVAIVDGAEDLTWAAQISLLKILEESPPHLQWIWVVLSENRLLPTIVSRANFRVYFHPLEEEVMTSILIDSCGAAPERAQAAASKSAGSLERARHLLDNKGSESAWPALRDKIAPAQIYQMTQRIARYKSAARARQEARDFLDELEIETLALWRKVRELRSLRELRALLAARQELEGNVTPALVLERLLLGFFLQHKTVSKLSLRNTVS